MDHVVITNRRLGWTWLQYGTASIDGSEWDDDDDDDEHHEDDNDDDGDDDSGQRRY